MDNNPTSNTNPAAQHNTKSRKKIFFFILIIFFIAIISYVSFFVGSAITASNYTAYRQSTITPTPTPTPILNNDTSSWAKYSNSSMKIKFKFPSKYINFDEDPNSISISYNIYDTDNSEPQEVVDEIMQELGFWSFQIHTKNTYNYKLIPICGENQFLSDDPEEADQCLVENPKDISVGGKPAKNFHVRHLRRGITNHVIQIVNNPTIEIIIYGHNEENSLADEILSTFKFTE